jgi:hypothetical protein
MSRSPGPLSPLLFCLLVAVAGCEPTVTRLETTVLPDGSIDRAFLQPRERTPDESLAKGGWEQVTWMAAGDAREFAGPVRSLKIVNREEVDHYAAAWGHFPDVRKVPDHYVRSVEHSDKTSQLKRDLKITDYGLVTEYLWSETLTDRVPFDEYREARTELFRLLSAFYEYILSEGMSDDYEVSKLVRWLRTDGQDWFYAVTGILYESGIPLSSAEKEAFNLDLFRVSLRHGLCPPGHEASEFQTADGDFDIQLALPIVVQHCVKRRDGKPLTPDETAAIVKVFVLDFETSKPLEARLDKARLQAIERFPGGEESLRKQQAQLAIKMLGVQGAGYTSMESFDCLLQIPGEVVETNGELQSNSTARWNFSATKAWPRGYKMRCRSLLDRTPDIRKFVQDTPQLNRSQMLKVIDLVSQDDELRELLIECRTSESLEPLRKLAELGGNDSFAKEVLDIVEPDKATTQ